MRRTICVFLFVSVMLFPACRPMPTYVSTNGIQYYSATKWFRHDIEHQETAFLKAFEKLKGVSPYKSVQGLRVIVTEEPIDCGGIDANGCQDNDVIVVKNLGTAYDSALTHEIAHWLQQDLFGITDYEHSDKELWRIADTQYID